MTTSQSVSFDLYKQINTQEAASFLSVTPRYLEQLRQHGNGPRYVKVSPRCVRYRIQDLFDFQEAHLRENTIQA